MDSFAGTMVDSSLHTKSDSQGSLGVGTHHSDEYHENLDWIEGCYSKLHAVSKALDKHLMTTANRFPQGDINNENTHDESVGDPDEFSASVSAHNQEEDTLMDLCSPDACHLRHDNFDLSKYAGDLPPFDSKGKQFAEYLEELSNQGFDRPFEESLPSDFEVPDALSIMDARMARLAELKTSNGQDAAYVSCVDSEQEGVDLDPSLLEYLNSDNDITSHPLYKRLCAAHISLCKLGATEAQLKEMEDLSHELESKLPPGTQPSSPSPELDKFIVDYCDFLELHKEFAKPFDEAMEFCKQIDEELADSGLKFIRENCSGNKTFTDDTVSVHQEMPLDTEV